MATPTLRTDSAPVTPQAAERAVTHLRMIDAITEPVGIARALTRALTDNILDENDRAWIEVALRNEIDRADAVLAGKESK